MICDLIVFDTNDQKVCEKLIYKGDKVSFDMAIHIMQNYEYSPLQMKTVAHLMAGTDTINKHNNKEQKEAHMSKPTTLIPKLSPTVHWTA